MISSGLILNDTRFWCSFAITQLIRRYLQNIIMSTDASKPLLTIGAIAKDGALHMPKTLAAIDTLFAALKNDYDCHLFLVDSASSDTTADIMLEFAKEHSNVRVFQMQGKVNASAARNVYLEHVQSGYLILIDGDIALELEFVTEAIDEMKAGNADVIYGKLPEIWYDEQHNAYGGQDDRYNVHRREYIEWFKGAFMLSPRAVDSQFRFDESFRRLEDIEFSVRVAEKFRVLTLPITMGTHHTDGYHSNTRLKEFVSGGYQIPAGQFIRANLFKPKRLVRVRRAYIGYLVGLAMQAIVVLGLLLLSPIIMLFGAGLLALDFIRFKRQGRAEEFLPLRFIGAWQLLVGLFKPRRAAGPYEVQELTNSVSNKTTSLSDTAAA